MEALQFLLPCTFCDELVVKGDDCPSWRKSLIVKFNFWLNKTSTYSEMSDSHTKQKKKTSKPTTIERPRTEQLLFFLVPVENPPFIQLFFTTQIFKFYCIRVARTKSPHRASTCAGHVPMGLPLLLYGSPPRRGESEPSPGGRLPTIRFSSCGQEHSFYYHQIHLACPQAVICWMLTGFRSCATPLGTFRRGTLLLSYCYWLLIVDC